MHTEGCPVKGEWPLKVENLLFKTVVSNRRAFAQYMTIVLGDYGGSSQLRPPLPTCGPQYSQVHLKVSFWTEPCGFVSAGGGGGPKLRFSYTSK